VSNFVAVAEAVTIPGTDGQELDPPGDSDNEDGSPPLSEVQESTPPANSNGGDACSMVSDLVSRERAVNPAVKSRRVLTCSNTLLSCLPPLQTPASDIGGIVGDQGGASGHGPPESVDVLATGGHPVS
jgi:hypothetical protein